MFGLGVPSTWQLKRIVFAVGQATFWGSIVTVGGSVQNKKKL